MVGEQNQHQVVAEEVQSQYLVEAVEQSHYHQAVVVETDQVAVVESSLLSLFVKTAQTVQSFFLFTMEAKSITSTEGIHEQVSTIWESISCLRDSCDDVDDACRRMTFSFVLLALAHETQTHRLGLL